MNPFLFWTLVWLGFNALAIAAVFAHQQTHRRRSTHGHQ